jgi:DNA helicase-2/ATP-dependent DNA helicase PcrA
MFRLEDLNDAQLEAVKASEGPALVLAGAGSGKTRVITYRIAYLLQEGLAKPWEIMAVTFTNKAASEMRQRVFGMLGQENSDLYIGTFHSFGARFLRKHAEMAGRTGQYTIYDDDDKSALIKTILKPRVGSTEVRSYLSGVKSFIERVKYSRDEAEALSAVSDHPSADIFQATYKGYETALKQNNAFDFDDLILWPCRLLQQDKQLRDNYRQRFRYLLIDEFQDTNYSQGELARLLSAPSGNITAVGDDDQSIYGWRGAHLGNILQFEADYRGVKTFRLEENYRSTQAILDVAHHVIKKNSSRHPKELWTSRKGGAKPVVMPSNDDREEAREVISRVNEIIRRNDYDLGDVAVLYRTNAQSRAFEEALRENRMPYIIVGGLKFYERKEVKDLLAYLRLLVNPNDELSLQRIINLPPRGIGQKTLARLVEHATNVKLPLVKVIPEADKIDGIGRKASESIVEFSRWMVAMRDLAAREDLFHVGERLLSESGLLDYYRKEDAAKSMAREENLSELLNAIREYSYSRPCLEDLDDFLQEVALVTDIDSWDADEQAVTLMTLHSAKGLEFPVVFITGLEEGLLPIRSALDEPEELEEERRLFYVGSTRARDQLYLTYARNRMRWGQEIPWQMPSRFLNEIPRNKLDYQDDPRAFNFESARRPKPKGNTIGISALHGAAYSQPQGNATEYSLGSRVKHNKFGEGVIIHTEGRGEGLRLLVNFEDGGQKLLLASYAKLTVI